MRKQGAAQGQILATSGGRPVVTQVISRYGCKALVFLAIAVFSFRAFTQETSPQQAGRNVSKSADTQPAAGLYSQLRTVGLDANRVFLVREASIDRDQLHITLNDGTIAFTEDVDNRITGA